MIAKKSCPLYRVDFLLANKLFLQVMLELAAWRLDINAGQVIQDLPIRGTAGVSQSRQTGAN